MNFKNALSIAVCLLCALVAIAPPATAQVTLTSTTLSAAMNTCPGTTSRTTRS